MTREVLDKTGNKDAARAKLKELLLVQANAEALCERSWVSKLGFDPQPQELRPLAELLAGNANGKAVA